MAFRLRAGFTIKDYNGKYFCELCNNQKNDFVHQIFYCPLNESNRVKLGDLGLIPPNNVNNLNLSELKRLVNFIKENSIKI